METSNDSLTLFSKIKGAGEVWISRDLDLSKTEVADLRIIADSFAKMGCVVKILCPIHYRSKSYQDIFGPLLGTRYERKCPDLWIDGAFYEYESYVRPWNKRKLSNMLCSGLKQSDRIIIDSRDGVPTRRILRSIRSRLNVQAPIQEVWIFDGSSVVQVYP